MATYALVLMTLAGRGEVPTTGIVGRVERPLNAQVPLGVAMVAVRVVDLPLDDVSLHSSVPSAVIMALLGSRGNGPDSCCLRCSGCANGEV